jgi:hypothetical protein
LPKKKRIHWSPAEAGQVLDRADRSGLTNAAFAKRHRLSAKRLGWWRKRLDRQKRGRRRSRFIEVRTAAAERIEIELRNGRRVVVPATTDAKLAATFVDAIGNEPDRRRLGSGGDPPDRGSFR